MGRYNCSARATDGNVRSIPVDWLCDGENDCGDIGAEDETNCSSGKKLESKDVLPNTNRTQAAERD